MTGQESCGEGYLCESMKMGPEAQAAARSQCCQVPTCSSGFMEVPLQDDGEERDTAHVEEGEGAETPTRDLAVQQNKERQ